MNQAARRRPVLELEEITKEFPGTRALDAVSLHVDAGEIVCLLGENGAGKSTLMKILSGVWPHGSFTGELRVAAPSLALALASARATDASGSAPPQPARFRDTRDAHAAGIAMIHQELSIFPELTVAEHLELDQLPHWIDWAALFARTQAFLDRLALGLRADARVGDLSVGGRQLVEIARALYRDARVLIFDEPTSALTDQEVSHLYVTIERLRGEGRAIVYITHRMAEVFHLADRMIVLRDGRNAGECARHAPDGKPVPREELEPQLIAWMVGRPIHDIYPARNTRFGGERLRVENLTLTNPNGRRPVQGLSFCVKAGEVLGLAGLLGAGRSESFEALFGVLGASGPRGRGYDVQGRIWIDGHERPFPESPDQALEAGMAFVSEDRKGSGLVLGQSIRANMALPSLVAGRAGYGSAPNSSHSTKQRKKGLTSLIADAPERESVARWMRELKVKAAGAEQAVGELSGGNQQKVVLAKWLMTEPRILFLDEPTRGIDVGAKTEIYHWIHRLAEEGMAIVVASSEMPELLGLCHRLIVLREGRPSAELPAHGTTQEEIMRAASL